MKHLARATLALFISLASPLLVAQSLVGVPEFIRVQREAIDQDRQAIMSTYEQAAKACWQKFAVNACLSDARQVRRAALEPLRQKDLVLNTQERLWRTEQRDLRLQGKQPENRGQP
ncbi:hypothetical protein [Limnohabitans sp. G3-2]|uniref:hypothetical protein n=1 Tax=Limnohabitans sp. G3-2 TaxID=1100711 RepID=UPI000C1DFC32|nr:hypothetical protein [Limnohabitans sp. G3-2]PIT71780.1 hypothetical protein B9Z31_14420 [Limnohabitans sp. G3-2]